MSERTIEGYLGALRPELMAEKKFVTQPLSLLQKTPNNAEALLPAVTVCRNSHTHTPADPERPAPFHFHLVISIVYNHTEAGVQSEFYF